MKAKTIDNETLFEEFEQTIEAKYGHMADEMLLFFDAFSEFFYEKDIDIDKLTTEHIKPLMNGYLNIQGLQLAEASMLFQTLIDFCNFCTTKNINYGFFKKYLLNEKNMLYGWWTFGNENLPEIDTKEVMDDFDALYNSMRSQAKGQTTDIDTILDFLEKAYDFLQQAFTVSLELRQKHPELTEQEHIRRVEAAVSEEPVQLSDFKNIQNSIFLLPKKQAKKLVEISFKIGANEKLPPGSSERKQNTTEALAGLKELITDIKNLQEKKNK